MNMYKGFSLSEALMALAVMGALTAAVMPMVTIKQKNADLEVNAATCIKTLAAADLSTGACKNAIDKCRFSQEEACPSLIYLTEFGENNTEKQNARKVLQEACNQGGKEACNYFVQACMKDSAECDIDTTGDEYDLDYYLKLTTTGNTPLSRVDDSTPYPAAKFTIAELIKPFYQDGVGNTNIVNAVDNACCPSTTTLACYIIGLNGECPYALQYGDDENEEGNSIVASGDYLYIAGEESSSSPDSGGTDAFVMKVRASDGVVIWKNQYGGNNDDNAYEIAISGNYLYVTGIEYSAAPDTDDGDVFVMKLNEIDGSAVWVNQYGGSLRDNGSDIIVSGSNLYVTGHERSSPGVTSPDIFVMKLNESNGVVDWKRHYGGDGGDYGFSIVMSGSNLYVTGQQNSDIGHGWDYYVMKLNEIDGTVVWKNIYGGQEPQRARDIIVSGSYLYVIGSDDDESNIQVVLKLNEDDGSIVWKNKYGGGANGNHFGQLTIYDDSLYVIGDTGSNILVMKLSEADGTVEWKNMYGGSGEEEGNAIVISGGYIYITGAEGSDTDGLNDDILLMKLSTEQTSSNITDWVHDGVNITHWDNYGTAITQWTAEDPITAWGLEGETLNDEPLDTLWNCEGVTLNDEPITGWSLEGTTLNEEVIDEWTFNPLK